LVDPLGDDPIVISGSANFSPASTTANDENMLVIRGNTDVADVYFGEFMRLFDHIYARHIITRKLTKAAEKKRNYLANDDSWVASNRQGPKARRRQRFHGPWT
jgi:phosphatidylserine/phosphatidylglycerophosphate/cardiolipin synthase-like enzyme